MSLLLSSFIYNQIIIFSEGKINMNDNDFGKLIFRLTIAILMLFHGYAKIKYGLGFIEGLLQAKGLPTFIS